MFECIRKFSGTYWALPWKQGHNKMLKALQNVIKTNSLGLWWSQNKAGSFKIIPAKQGEKPRAVNRRKVCENLSIAFPRALRALCQQPMEHPSSQCLPLHDPAGARVLPDTALELAQGLPPGSVVAVGAWRVASLTDLLLHKSVPTHQRCSPWSCFYEASRCDGADRVTLCRDCGSHLPV